MTADKFQEIKTEILSRAKEAEACTEQYGRAYKSKNLAELMTVVKDNFHWACKNDVITEDIVAKYHDVFATHRIYCNEDARDGYLLAYGNAYISSRYIKECKLNGNAIYRVAETDTIYYANPNLKFVKQ